MPAAPGDVRLDADDRLHSRVTHLVIEGERAIEVSVVGYRHRGHLQFRGSSGQRLDLYCAIEQAVIGM